MAPVFGHGRLRLYLLKLLAEAPRHGYELIRLLEERFEGHYAPSAGTVYPRLAKLETEGLVSHTTEGGRKVYAISTAGRAELASRQDELSELEAEISASLAALATDIQRDVSGSARSLRDELHQQAGATRPGGSEEGRQRTPGPGDRPGGEQLRRAQRHAQRARERAAEARRHARDGNLHEAPAAWASALAQTMDELGRGLADWSRDLTASGRDRGGDEPGETRYAPGAHHGSDTADGQEAARESPGAVARGRPPSGGAGEPTAAGDRGPSPASEDAYRELERLLDQVRDEVRDAARDHGVSQEQLRVVRRHLSATAAHLSALLRAPQTYRDGTGQR